MERRKRHDFEDPYNLAEDSFRPPKGGARTTSETVKSKTKTVKDSVKKAIPPVMFESEAVKAHKNNMHNPLRGNTVVKGSDMHEKWIDNVKGRSDEQNSGERSGSRVNPDGGWLEQWNRDMVMRPGDERAGKYVFRPRKDKKGKTVINEEGKIAKDTIDLIDEDDLRKNPHLARILSTFAIQDRVERETQGENSNKHPYNADYESVWAQEAKKPKKKKQRSAARQIASRAYDYVSKKATSAGKTAWSALGSAARSVGSAVSSGWKSTKKWLGGLFGGRKNKAGRPVVEEPITDLS